MTGSAFLLLAGLAATAGSASHLELLPWQAVDRAPVVDLAQATTASPAATPSYGYQPYNDKNPTGFYHPNGMGYGSYYMTPKYHGHRIPALQNRKFRGN